MDLEEHTFRMDPFMKVNGRTISFMAEENL